MPTRIGQSPCTASAFKQKPHEPDAWTLVSSEARPSATSVQPSGHDTASIAGNATSRVSNTIETTRDTATKVYATCHSPAFADHPLKMGARRAAVAALLRTHATAQDVPRVAAAPATNQAARKRIAGALAAGVVGSVRAPGRRALDAAAESLTRELQRSGSALLLLDEREQIRVDLVFVRRAHAV